jgi:broad specificity phosphatase PhoE
MERIILVRHGQTNKNAEGKLHMADDGESLNNVGIEQIKKTAEKLKGFLPAKVYSSKEKRATESAQIIAKELGIASDIIEGMQERNWGDFSGNTWEEILKILQPMSLEERYLYIPPSGESWKQFESRLIQAINVLLSQNKNKTIVVVSHMGAIRALMPYLLGLPKEESFKYEPGNASVVVFNHDNGKFFQQNFSL